MTILLLQGPLGPFFNQFKCALVQQGYDVHRIVFNGGDEWYDDSDANAFTGSLHDWSHYFTDYIRKHEIKTVFAYGDCRAYHIDAKRVCIHEQVRYFAFEEGYLRPNYITLEEGGVNGHSPIVHDAIDRYKPIHSPKDEEVIPPNFAHRVKFAMVYYAFAFFRRLSFFEYQHHRSLSPFYEGLCWVRGFYRKWIYKLTQPSAKRICEKGDFFLVPLQVHNDAQIEFHSHFDDMHDFITEALESYSKSGCTARLIFKHHPMDRGYVNYRAYIIKRSKQFNISDRVSYIHDQHLPTLLKSCLGVVTINSTTALQAFYHSAPVIALGDAFFDMPGLTNQKGLDVFWSNPEKPNMLFADQFKAFLLDHGQINGSYYCESDMTIKNVIAHLKDLNVI